MSNEGGAPGGNAQLVISTDYESFKEFVEYGKKGLGDFSGKGKSAFGDLSKEATAAARSMSQRFMDVGNDLGRTLTAPMLASFDQMIARAEKLRGVVSGISVSTGKSEGDVRRRIEKAADAARVPFEQMEPYAQQFRRETGDVDAAIQLAPIGRAAGLGPGRSMGEMAHLQAELYNRLNLRTPQQQEKFFNQVASGAKRMGVPEERAFLALERSMPVLARTSSDPQALAGMVTALARDRDPTAVAETMGRFLGVVEGFNPAKFLGELRQRKRLGRNETVYDSRGRVDLVRALDLADRDMRASGRNQERLGIDIFGGAAGLADYRRLRETLTGGKEAASAETADVLAERKARWEKSEEGREYMKERQRHRENLEEGRELLQNREAFLDWMPGGRRGGVVGAVAGAGASFLTQPWHVPGTSIPLPSPAAAVMGLDRLGKARFNLLDEAAALLPGGGGNAEPPQPQEEQHEAAAKAIAAELRQQPLPVRAVGPSGPPTPKANRPNQ